MNLKSFQPYLLRIKTELIFLSSTKYFEPAVAVTVFLIFFLIGRKSYQSKFTTVLNTINDSQNEKKRLKTISQDKKQSLRNIRMKSTLFKMLTAIIILAIAAYFYLKKFNPLIAIAAGSGIFIFWIVVIIWEKYVETSIKSTDERLQKKLLSTQNDAKEIMSLLGEDLCKQIKIKFERQIEFQSRTEQLKDCDLKKCYDQKTIYKDLYSLYKEIIGEMQKTQWCDICAQQLNTDTSQLKLNEFESRLKNYKGLSQKLNLEKKKELTNKLLQQWQILEGTLPFMCKRGCCIRFRLSLDTIKKVHHQRLKSLKSRLVLIK